MKRVVDVELDVVFLICENPFNLCLRIREWRGTLYVNLLTKRWEYGSERNQKVA